MRQKRGSGTNGQERSEASDDVKGSRIDLSVPQVAGSTLAAVAAAVLASQLGVYGTVIGAGVVSVVATCGGPLFQHVFSRTGAQLREATVQAGPKGRRAPAVTGPLGDLPEERSARRDGAFGEARTYGTRVRGWKRSAAAAAVVFAVAMAGITGYELAAGEDLNGGKGTTVGTAFGGGGGSGRGTGSSADDSPDSAGSNNTPSRSPDRGATGEPDTEHPDEADPSGSTGPAPTPSESPAPTSGAATPAPTASPESTSGGDAASQDPAAGPTPPESTGTAPAGQ
ncbi:hypothetical protein ACF08N_20780 [Streptomyces sp. NPDC015127]|uniref:hypothetical protein n=1 Tax=Streptomyces sp. NPDC015127 TaxID=3364939 RepID=UPI0036F669F3